MNSDHRPRVVIVGAGFGGLWAARALAGGLLMAAGFLAFLVNIVSTLGWANVLGLVAPERWQASRTGQAKA